MTSFRTTSVGTTSSGTTSTTTTAGDGRSGSGNTVSDDPGEPARHPSAAGSTAITKTRRTWRLPVEAEAERPDFAVVRRLMLGSALMLFLELALIRWLGSNVVHLCYFSNFVLLGSFLGIGLGFLIARHALVGAAGRRR